MTFNVLCDTRCGKMLVNKNDWPIGMSLLNYGEYAWMELEFLRQMITPGMLVIDAGANIGTHTLFFSELVGEEGAVVSFEPQRIAFQTLCANTALNSLTNVYAFHAAVGSKNSTIIVPVRDQEKSNNFGGVPLAGVTVGEKVQLLSIDSLKLKRCDLIKADVEGMEAEMLEGARQTITDFRPLMYLEADGAQKEDAINLLFELGYDCYWHIPTLFNPGNLKSSENLLKDADDVWVASINMLCVPAEKHINIVGMKKITAAGDQPSLNPEKEECLV